MKLGKTTLAIAGATVLLAAFVSMASAGRLSTTNQNLRAVFTRANFIGGFGTIECELVMNGSFHERTIAKTAGRLTGVISAENVTRCARGGATVQRETLPWHVQYNSFTGTLPNISTIGARIIGTSFRIREPTFGVTCQGIASAEAPAVATFNREATGVVNSISMSGSIPCGAFTGTFSGTSSSFETGGGSRITVTLI